MALGACHGRSHPGGEGGIHPVHHRHVAELLVIGSALVVGLGISMKGRGDQLTLGRLGQQIARQLFDAELVEGQVVVEGPDDVIPIGPDGPGAVVRIARGIRVAGEIQPHPRPVLTELRSGHQAVDVVSVGIRALVGKKGIQVLWGRGQSDQIEGNPPGERSPIGHGAQSKTFLRQPPFNEMIDRMNRLRNLLPDEGLVGPVLVELRPLPDPLPEQGDLLLAQTLSPALGRHEFGIPLFQGHPEKNFTLLGVSRDNRRVSVQIPGGAFEGIQAQTRFAVFLVGTVAGDAAVRQQGFDLGVEINRIREDRTRGRTSEQEELGESLHSTNPMLLPACA